MGKRPDRRMAQTERKKLRVLVADDHPVIRSGLRKIMEEEPEIALYGEAGNAEELLHLVRVERWDILILDINLPDRSGLDVLSDLHAFQPELKVIVLSIQDEPAYVGRAFSRGASGYLSKDCETEEVMEAVREVMEGRSYVSRALADRLGHSGSRYQGRFPPPKGGFAGDVEG